MMTGWKTWVASACMAGLGVISVVNGETVEGVQQVVAALALIGVGHKIEKAADKK